MGTLITLCQDLHWNVPCYAFYKRDTFPLFRYGKNVPVRKLITNLISVNIVWVKMPILHRTPSKCQLKMQYYDDASKGQA